MVIPFHKPSIYGGEIKQVIQAIKGGFLDAGSRTRQFEKEFSGYVKRKHAVAVNSCTAALHLALEAIGLEAGQGVLVPTMTFAASAEVVRHFDAFPILADCNPSDFNLDVVDAEQRLQQATAQGIKVVAIMPTHFAGQVGDVNGLRRLAQKYRLNIIGDAAHCCPAFFRESAGQKWKTVGAGSDITCFSFGANKPITTGQGGMACTDRPDYADRMRLLSQHGLGRSNRKRNDSAAPLEVIEPGYQYNLTDLAAAMGLHQLKKADRLQMMRTRVAEHYEHLLSDVAEITLPTVYPDRIHSWHLYVIRLKGNSLSINRAELMQLLKDVGISTAVHYLPLHLHAYYREQFEYSPQDLPCAASVYPEMLSLPIYPEMTLEEVEYVAEHLQRIIVRHRKCLQLSVIDSGGREHRAGTFF